MTPRFDAYTATVRGVRPDAVLALASEAVSASGMRQGRGYHGFAERVSVQAADGHEAFAVSFGGQLHRDLVMLEAKGETTPAVVAAFRASVPEHACTRADSCADFEGPGTWEALSEAGLAVKRRYRLKGEKRGDWEDFPEDGRTLYLGAPSSAVRVRIYEKGKQPELRHLERWSLVRTEVQVRPEGAARASYARASALDVWGASEHTRALAAAILKAQVQALSPYTAQRESTRDRALRVMCEQYGAHLMSLWAELGDWRCVGVELGEMIQRGGKRRPS